MHPVMYGDGLNPINIQHQCSHRTRWSPCSSEVTKPVKSMPAYGCILGSRWWFKNISPRLLSPIQEVNSRQRNKVSHVGIQKVGTQTASFSQLFMASYTGLMSRVRPFLSLTLGTANTLVRMMMGPGTIYPLLCIFWSILPSWEASSLLLGIR
jgi:hypothetical protein